MSGDSNRQARGLGTVGAGYPPPVPHRGPFLDRWVRVNPTRDNPVGGGRNGLPAPPPAVLFRRGRAR